MFSLLDSMNMSNCARHLVFDTEMHYGDFNMADGSAVKEHFKRPENAKKKKTIP